MPKVKVPRLCSRSQPGIKVIIRDHRGHLLHNCNISCFLVIPSGTNLLLAWVVQPVKEKIVQTLTLTWLLKSFNAKKNESDLMMGKDSYNLFD